MHPRISAHHLDDGQQTIPQIRQLLMIQVNSGKALRQYSTYSVRSMLILFGRRTTELQDHWSVAAHYPYKGQLCSGTLGTWPTAVAGDGAAETKWGRQVRDFARVVA